MKATAVAEYLKVSQVKMLNYHHIITNTDELSCFCIYYHDWCAMYVTVHLLWITFSLIPEILSAKSFSTLTWYLVIYNISKTDLDTSYWTMTLTNVMHAQTAGQNNNGYCYDACAYCRAWRHIHVSDHIIYTSHKLSILDSWLFIGEFWPIII